MKRKINLFLILTLLFFVSLASANGLTLKNNVMNVTQQYNKPLWTNITITNTESMTFYNITLEDNQYATMKKIPKLEAGQIIKMPIKINSINSGNVSLKIFGYYLASLGEHNNTYNVIVDSESISKCQISATIGSKIKWINRGTITENFTIVNSETNYPIRTLEPNSTWIQNLDKVGEIPFHIVDRTGFAGKECMIDVLSDSGYINNPSYDAKLNLQIKVIYPSTEIKANFLTTKYTMNFSDSQQDIFSIKNIGNKTAKNISLSGQWLKFTSNHFDLAPQQTKNIGYTITPIIRFTNQTGKTWIKQIILTGNFPTIKQNIDIKINHANIVNQSSSNVTSLKDYICKNFPQFCKPQIVYKYVAKGDEKVNVSFTQNQVRDLYRLFFSFSDAQAIRNKQFIAYQDSLNKSFTKMQQDTQNTNDNIQKVKQSIQDSNTAWLFTGFIFVLTLMGALVLILIYKYKTINQNNEWTKYA